MIPLLLVAAAAQAQWVPLNGAQAKQAQAAPVSQASPTPPPVTVAVAPGAAVAPRGLISQPVTAHVAPQAVILGSSGDNVLRSGTEVPLVLEEGLDSNDKTIREGQQFRMSVANNVMLGNVVVIPAGSPATGEITELKHKGMWGKSGHISARVLNVRVGGRLIHLTGNFDEHGVTGTAGVVGAVVFVPIAGFFLTGTSAKIPVGAGVRAFLDEDLTIATPQAATVIPTAAVAPQPH